MGDPALFSLSQDLRGLGSHGLPGSGLWQPFWSFPGWGWCPIMAVVGGTQGKTPAPRQASLPSGKYHLSLGRDPGLGCELLCLELRCSAPFPTPSAHTHTHTHTRAHASARARAAGSRGRGGDGGCPSSFFSLHPSPSFFYFESPFPNIPACSSPVIATGPTRNSGT